MKKTKVMKRQVLFEDIDFEILRRYAQEKALGGKWLSSATRGIIRDYDRAQKNDNGNSKDTPTG